MTQDNFLVTRVDDVLNWARKSSAWYLLFGTACCAIELMQTGGPRSDIERFGMAPRASPRQADLIIVAGTVTYKMATRIKMLYDQMPEPKYVAASRPSPDWSRAGSSSHKPSRL
jgi:NADH-quinone oxidoreductase subunit B